MKRYVIKKIAGAEISTRAMREYENAIDAFIADGMNYKPDELGSYESREQALEALKEHRCTVKAMTSYGVLVAVDECDKPKFYEADMVYIDEQEYDEDFESWESTGECEFAEVEM